MIEPQGQSLGLLDRAKNLPVRNGHGFQNGHGLLYIQRVMEHFYYLMGIAPTSRLVAELAELCQEWVRPIVLLSLSNAS